MEFNCSFYLLLLSTLLITLLPSSSLVHGNTCIHDSVFDANAVDAIPLDYSGSYPTAANTQPIRLKIDRSYLQNDLLGRTCMQEGQVVQAQASSTGTTTTSYTCTKDDVVTVDVLNYISNLLDKAEALFKQTLYVMPVQNGFKLSTNPNIQGLYGGVYMDAYGNPTDGIDMVIFATARPMIAPEAESTLAVAVVVQEDQFRRPICGHLNIKVSSLDLSVGMSKRNFGVVIHEMTHSLGFTYQKFTNINPAPGSTTTDITLQLNLNVAAGNKASQRVIIASPKVQAWARKYYGCDSVLGVELENQGGSGTQYSHWEKRTANNEYMTGTASQNPVFSELTLSYFEDSGWYHVNYSQAQQLLWGQGMGCDFVLKSCPSWPAGQGYFCTEPDKTGCTADYQAKGYCQIGTGNVPADYQYFSGSPTEVGAQDLPDYCPLYWGYSNGWCFDTSNTPNVVNNGETYSDNARCYQSSLLKGLPIASPTAMTCYDTFCTGPSELRVKVDSYYYDCPPNADISVIGYGGTISCPGKIEQVCGNSPNDTSWPAILTVSPNAGGPGLKVTITGRNFQAGTTVTIADPLDDVVVVSSTTITATIPSSNSYKNPTNIIDKKESVIVIDPKGRSTVGYNKFTIKVALNKTFIKNALEYLKDNWLVTAAIIAAIVISCLICGYCCYRQKGKAEEADTEYYA